MRIFIGLPVTNPLKTDINQMVNLARDEHNDNSFKWTVPDNLHLTLYYLGETDEKLIPKLAEKLKEKARELQPINSYCKNLIALPSLKHPRALAYYIKPTPELLKCAQLIQSAVAEMNIKKGDDPFLPHITIARIRSAKKFKLIERLPLPKNPLTANSLIIYESRSTDTGVKYIPLETIPFSRKP